MGLKPRISPFINPRLKPGAIKLQFVWSIGYALNLFKKRKFLVYPDLVAFFLPPKHNSPPANTKFHELEVAFFCGILCLWCFARPATPCGRGGYLF